jgi:hypothetical protein
MTTFMDELLSEVEKGRPILSIIFSTFRASYRVTNPDDESSYYFTEI